MQATSTGLNKIAAEKINEDELHKISTTDLMTTKIKSNHVKTHVMIYLIVRKLNDIHLQISPSNLIHVMEVNKAASKITRNISYSRCFLKHK